MESLQTEVEPFGITTTIVEPGFFRTELEPESTTWPELTIDDYAERTAGQREWREAQNGRQAGDPAKLAQALLTIADQEQSPLRFMAGADSIELAEQKVAALQQQITAFRELSSSLALDDLQPAATGS
jgi:NAD(P)-dependent dehydrogenase (short-subunit alcohol dehydrogenase family)